MDTTIQTETQVQKIKGKSHLFNLKKNWVNLLFILLCTLGEGKGLFLHQNYFFILNIKKKYTAIYTYQEAKNNVYICNQHLCIPLYQLK